MSLTSIGGAIKGIVTRLVAGVAGAADRVFFQPINVADAAHVDGVHRAGIGEIVAEASHEGLEVGKAAVFQLVKDGEREVVKLADAAGAAATKAVAGTPLAAPLAAGESLVSNAMARISSLVEGELARASTKLARAVDAYVAGLSGKAQSIVDAAIADLEKRAAAVTPASTSTPAADTNPAP